MMRQAGIGGGAVLALLLLAPVSGPAQAQQDWFRPPGNVGQSSRSAPPPTQQQSRPSQQQQRRQQQAAPSRQQPAAAPPQQQRGWNPFQPLIDLFRPDDEPAPRYAAPPRPRDMAVPPPPATAARPPTLDPPAEPRGEVYSTAGAAREDQGESLKSIVLVLGDEYAQPLAQGLADAFAADRKGVAVVGRSEAGSGFAPASRYDWIGNGRALASSETPTAIVVFAGTSDLAPIADAGGQAELFDERWRDLYARRIDDFLLGLKLQGRPVFVVGLPPVDDAAASDRNVRFNELLKERTERAGGTFVDVWDGFVDENGQFMMSGPAVDGQRRRLRTADGTGFTRAGGRKLAFFVDRELAPLLERNEAPITGEPAEARPSIIMLTGGNAGVGARTLAGGGPAAAAVPVVAPGNGTPAADDATRLLTRGEPLPQVSGRTDDFTWVPPARPAGSGTAVEGQAAPPAGTQAGAQTKPAAP